VKKHYPLWRKLAVLGAMTAGFGVNILLYSLAFLKRRDWNYLRENLGLKWKITQEMVKIF
jgi:hypothetical protein